jgi:hypothetical protein
MILRIRFPDAPGAVGRLMKALSGLGVDVVDMEIVRGEDGGTSAGDT